MYSARRSRTMDTEVIATSTLKTSISVTDFLSPYINERDKEPIWDGNIYVFSSKSKSNISCKGRVPVQVKSKQSNDLLKDKISFQIRTDDLRKYLMDNGVMYFVVYISNYGDTRIYYTDLLPFKIKQLLKDAEEQVTKTVSLRLFPTDNTEKVDLFFNFLRDRELQKSVSNMELVTIEELINMGQLKELSIGFTSTRTNLTQPFDYFFNHSTYLYATIPIGITIPVELMTEIVSAETTLNQPITCNGTQYYESYRVVHKKDEYELHFGNSIVFKFKKGTYDCTMNFNLQGTLRQRIIDELFLIEAIESRAINFGKVVISIKTDKPENIASFGIERRKEQLEFFKNVQKALNEVGVKEDDLDCKVLSDEDEANIRLLIDAFIHHKEVSLNKSAEVEPIGKMTIANICIMLIARKQENGLFLLTNFFNDHIALRVRNKENGDFNTSQFTIMNKENFLQLSNIDYDAIYSDIVSVDGNPMYYGQITQLLLEMLLAYDEGNSKNKVLLHAAQKLSEWLITTCDDTDDTHYLVLNHLQAIKRCRTLNEDEIKQLYYLIENGNASDAILTGAYILLENSSGAKLHFDKLPLGEQENFKRFPIYNLWKVI